MTRKKGFISPDLVDKVLNEAYLNGTREVGFYTTGEPLICKELENYITKAKKIGYDYVYVTTNGVLADRERVKKLADSGLDSIKFSINAIDGETYELIHGYDYFEKVCNNLKDTYTLRKENGYNLKIFVSYIMTRYSREDIDTIKQFFADWCDDVVVLNTINQSGLTPEINDYLRVSDDMDFSVDVNVKIPCSLLFNAMHVTYEGYLTACCADFQNYFVYADLNNTTLKEAWHNDIIVNFRKMQIEGNISGSLCDNCVNNLTDKAKPLIDKFATIFDSKSMFDNKELEQRIKLNGCNKCS